MACSKKKSAGVRYSERDRTSYIVAISQVQLITETVIKDSLGGHELYDSRCPMLIIEVDGEDQQSHLGVQSQERLQVQEEMVTSPRALNDKRLAVLSHPLRN
jgi:hypothetical protein